MNDRSWQLFRELLVAVAPVVVGRLLDRTNASRPTPAPEGSFTAYVRAQEGARRLT